MAGWAGAYRRFGVARACQFACVVGTLVWVELLLVADVDMPVVIKMAASEGIAECKVPT